MKFKIATALILAASVSGLSAQTIYEYASPESRVLFFDKNLSTYIPHMIRMYQNGKALADQIWQTDPNHPFDPDCPLFMVTDWEDDGNGGASALPRNMIQFSMAPLNFSYFISPSTERYNHLFRHEFTHTVMTDKTAAPDRFWRTVLGGKFTVDTQHPFSAVWSYLAAPRWYAPRWYHEGIACFMETWTGGGVGRALGGYDEMYFRSIVKSGDKLCSVVGLEMEGTTSDFQVGANSYLYGTRFDNYLVYRYGFDKLRDFYNRTEDSKALFNKQFRIVYGTSLRTVWNDWREFEVGHQEQQIEAISEYPLTETEPLTDHAMGSAAPLVYDKKNNCVYTALTYPGDMANVARIDLTTGKRTKIHVLDGPMLYQSCFLTLDQKNQRLVWTTQNGKFRGLAIYDLKRGRMQKHLDFQRVSNIAYDNMNDCMYGLFTNAGMVYICRYDKDFENRDLLYSFPFGVSVFDLAVSHDGKWLTMATSGDNGEQSLIRFSTEKLNNADFSYETLYRMDDSNMGLFRFSPDDRTMTGSSYYTGVSNIWELDLKSKKMKLLSNTTTGLFAPLWIDEENMLALEFERDGFRPVILKPHEIDDANAVTLLGQMAYEAHSDELEPLSELKTELPFIEFGQVYDSIHEYKPIKKFIFTGAYPELSGFRDRGAWNNVTPVLGYRFTFQDPLGLNSLKFSLGVSPWSGNDTKNQYHAMFEWKYMLWTVTAAWNPTSFYDLFGPIQTSRKGWSAGIGYKTSNSMKTPVTTSWGFDVNAYGMMDALPLYQEIEVSEDVNSFQTASIFYEYKKTRSSLGSVMPERGIVAGADASAYLVNGKLYPSVNGNLELGINMPFIRNTCLWLRNNIGQNFGDAGTVFGNTYFGGFGNNWVDYREPNQYRKLTTMPGAPIDDISARSYLKSTAELGLRPVRYKNLGLLNLYPTYTQLNLFSSALMADPWGSGERRAYFDFGAQLNTEMVLFKYLKTNFSIGYARVCYPGKVWSDDWMLSLKLL